MAEIPLQRIDVKELIRVLDSDRFLPRTWEIILPGVGAIAYYRRTSKILDGRESYGSRFE